MAINRFFVIFVVFLLFLPIFDGFLKFSPVDKLFEKRVLAKMPEISSDIAVLAKKFEDFFDDNYGFRKSLIALNSWALDSIFNQSPSDRALIGRQNWLYFDNEKSLLDAQGLLALDVELLEKAAFAFKKNYDNLRANGIDYVLVIAADKSSIYPEFLPKYVKFSQKNHRIDQFLAVLLQKFPDFPVVDLRAPLKEVKKREIIYHKTDTHWNARGAHVGYVAIMKKLGLKYYDRDRFDAVADSFYRGDISDIMNISQKNIDYDLRPKFSDPLTDVTEDFLSEGFYKPQVFVNKNDDLPVLFVYKDSFFDNMMRFFGQNFAKSYFINEFPCDLDLNVVKKYQPNVVIQEFWEARIEEIAKKCK